MSAVRPDLLPTAEELSAIRAVAIGDRPADLIVRGGTSAKKSLKVAA